jgi:IS1 family transposase
MAENLTDNLTNTVLPFQEDDILELDELWTFVQSKIHTYWVWIALCKRTRQVVAYHIGSRMKHDCKLFWDKVPKEYKQSITFSDYWKTYDAVIKSKKHISVGKHTGKTNHVERWNNTLRQRLGRFVRKTLSFSKSDYFLEANLRIFIH